MHAAELVRGAARPCRRRGAGALLRRSTRRARHHGLRPARRTSPDANAALQTLGVDLPMAQDCARRRRRALAHLVRQPRRPPGLAAARRSARRHRAQPRTVAPVEGRAARRWVRRLVVGRAHGVRERRGRRRGEPRHARGRPAQLPGRRPRPRARHPQRHRHRRRGRGATGRTPCGPSASTRTRRASSSSAASRARRGCRTSCAPRPRCHPTSSWCCALARPTPPRSCARSRVWSRVCAASGRAWCGSTACCARDDVVALLSAGTAFACPSVYEPLGIVNLEAMACELPVVGTATGGIPEVVVHGETGYLVPIEQADDGTGRPLDPDRFVRDLSAALVRAVSDPGRGAGHGARGPPARGRGLRLGVDRGSARPSCTRGSPASSGADGLAVVHRRHQRPAAHGVEAAQLVRSPGRLPPAHGRAVVLASELDDACAPARRGRSPAPREASRSVGSAPVGAGRRSAATCSAASGRQRPTSSSVRTSVAVSERLAQLALGVARAGRRGRHRG